MFFFCSFPNSSLNFPVSVFLTLLIKYQNFPFLYVLFNHRCSLLFWAHLQRNCTCTPHTLNHIFSLSLTCVCALCACVCTWVYLQRPEVNIKWLLLFCIFDRESLLVTTVQWFMKTSWGQNPRIPLSAPSCDSVWAKGSKLRSLFLYNERFSNS